MAALALLVMISLVAYRWFAEPLIATLSGFFQLSWLPWLLLLLGIWLLAGEPEQT